VDVLPFTKYDLDNFNGKFNQVSQWVQHPTDGPYWWIKSPESRAHEINIPLLSVGGWYDIFEDGNLELFTALQHKAASSYARDNQRLLVGPWAHFDGGFLKTEQGSVDYGPGLLAPNYNEIRLDFLDYWMKDIQHGTMMDLDKPVYIFVQGDNKWRAEAQWPLERAKETKFYLNGGKSGTIASLNDGTLSTSLPAKGEKPKTFVYDPMNAFPTRGGALLFSFQYGPDGIPGSEGVGQCQQEQTPVDVRSLTFTSKPLDKAVEITGKVRAVIYAASDCVDTDWVVRVNDVAPDGTSLNVVDGIKRARYRTSDMNPTLIEPGKIYAYEVDLWSNSYVFQPGHSIRVTVNSSSFPRWSRNMNVAEFPEQASEYKVARNTIYLDPQHPSHVILPVIPR
jgi:putative CocE/NonD family hydrolase